MRDLLLLLPTCSAALWCSFTVKASEMNGPVVLADKRLRRKTLCAATLVTVLGLIGLSCLTSYLDSLTVLQQTDPQQAAEHYAHLLLLLALSTVVGGAI